MQQLAARAPWAIFIATFVLLALSVVVASRSPPRLLLCGALIAATFALPLALPADLRFLRCFLAFAGFFALFRAVDLVRDRRQWSALHRAWLSVTLFDTRRVERVPPRFHFVGLFKAIAFSSLCAFGVWMALVVAARFSGAAHYALRWGGGAVAAYALLDIVTALANVIYAPLGLKVPPLQRSPILSRSVREFWGDRWNLTIRDWLYRNCLVPCARRRRPLLGLLAAFVVSAVLHAWPVFVGLDLAAAAAMGGFFVVQAVVIFLERFVGVERWRPGAAHAWAVFWLVGTSPLFVEPSLRLL